MQEKTAQKARANVSIYPEEARGQGCDGGRQGRGHLEPQQRQEGCLLRGVSTIEHRTINCQVGHQPLHVHLFYF